MDNSFFNQPIFSRKTKPFFISFISVFLIVALQYIGFRLPKIFYPQKNSQVVVEKKDIFETVLPKLKEKENTYKINMHPKLVATSYAAESFDNAAAYAVIDFDSGDVVLEKSLDEVLPMASLTKVMTAVVALDLAKLDESFHAPSYISSTIPTHIAIAPGESLTLDELLHAILMTSANDAAEVIRDGIDTKYGDRVFIRAMNEKAKLLGLENTHFTNPQGFDNPNHYSSVKDLAVLTQYALTHYPQIAAIAKKDHVILPANTYHKKFDLYNWNGLLDVYPDVTGVKIGNTGRAGNTTIVTSTRQGKTLIVIVLGAPGVIERDLWAAQLLDAGFAKTLGLDAVNITREQLLTKYGTWRYGG